VVLRRGAGRHVPCPRCDVYMISCPQSEHDKRANNIPYWLKKTLTSGATRIVDGHYIVKTHKGFKKVKIDMENINQEIKIEKL
jgi:hypothetical protein